MKKQLTSLFLLLLSVVNYAQDISYTFVNARNTNDGTDDFYEADIYAVSNTEFILGASLLYIEFNTAAFGDFVSGSDTFEFLQPVGSIFASTSPIGVPLYDTSVPLNGVGNLLSIVVNQGSVGAVDFGGNNITATPSHVFSIRLKYENIGESPDIIFTENPLLVEQNQIFTACGPYVSSGAPFNAVDCISEINQAVQLEGENIVYDSAGASLVSFIEWSGITSTAWGTDTNWLGDVLPTTTDDVSIANVTTTPIIASGEAFTVNSFLVTTDASLAISDSGYLRVDGDFTNDGTLTMTSTATESAALLVKGTATGAITYERGGLLAGEFSIVTAPVSGQSVKEFAENAANDIRINATVTPNRYAIAYYDDSQPEGSKWVYYTTDDLATDVLTFEQGTAYAISRATDGGVTFTGTLETTSVTKTLAPEWNGIGNPYTTFLPANENGDANFLAANLSQLNPANLGVYVWDNAQVKYTVLSLSGTESFIAPGQGFFVRASESATEVTFDESQRTKQPTTGGTFGKGTSESSSITLTATAGEKSVTTLINYSDATTEGLDPGYDLGNFAGASFDVFTKLVADTEGEDFTIQSVPLQTEEATSIPVGIVAAAGTTIRFSIAKDNLDTPVYLEDKLLNVLTKLDDAIYEVTMNEAVNGSGRFFLKTESSKALSVDDAAISSIKVYASNEALVVKGISKGEFDVQLFNILGKEVFKAKETGIGNNTLALPSLQTGIYLVKVNSSLGIKNTKILIK